MPVANNIQGLPPKKLYSGSVDLVSARTFKQGVEPDIKIKCNTFIIAQCDINNVQLAFNEDMFSNPVVINVVPYQKLLIIRAEINGIYLQNSAGGAGKVLKYFYGNDIDVFANPSTSSISIDQIGGSSLSEGQKTMAASIPVVIASDQSAVPISNANLDAALSTLATQATLAQIKAKTDNLDTLLSNLIVASGTATAGGATTLTDSGAKWTTNTFVRMLVKIIAGTGAGQTNTIVSNTGTQLSVQNAWTTNPDATSQYAVLGVIAQNVLNSDALGANLPFAVTTYWNNGSSWDRVRNQYALRQASSANATNVATISTYNLKELSIIVKRGEAGNLSGNMTVEVSADGTNYDIVDTVALPASPSTAKTYDKDHLATGLAGNPMDYKNVRITIDAQGASNTSVIALGGKQ